MIKDKKIFIIGDKDGVPAPIIEKCLNSSFGKIVFSTTECFSCSIAGVMDQELQNKLMDCVNQYGAEQLIVIIGGSDADASAMTADTISAGDETGFGILSGIKLGIPVYHIFEEEIKSLCEKDVFADQCEIIEMVLPVESIIQKMRASRVKYSKY